MSSPAQPLFDANPVADASHSVRAPGGYEWWYFDAEDPTTDTQIVGIFLNGFVFHPKYLRAYFRFLRRPTRHLPPLPIDYTCAYLVVYRAGKILSQFMTHHAPQAYSAARDTVAVTIGRNSLIKRDGAFHLHLEGPPWAVTWQGPKVATDDTLSADFLFAPTFAHPASERIFLSREAGGAEHHWVIANPACAVTGTIQPGKSSEAIPFAGRGYHDHNYGTGPLGPGLAKWFWGRAMLHDRVITFHHAVPKDSKLPAESHTLIANASGIIESSIVPSFGAARRTGWGLAYPLEARWECLMTLSRPRVIDSAPFYLRVQYDAQIGEESTTAFCEMAYPHRLRWPILGRMIEASIFKIKSSK